MSIGDVTVSQQNPDVVWVGTGEVEQPADARRGAIGVWKSTDGGKTFAERRAQGLEAHQPHPDRSDATTTSCSSRRPDRSSDPGGDRGVYKTTDGGKTWKRVLFVDDETGANDLVMSLHRSEDALRVDVPAPSHGVLRERRRSGKRNLEVDRRRRHVDAPHQRIARAARLAGSASTRIARTATSCTRLSKRRGRRAAAAAAARSIRRLATPHGRGGVVGVAAVAAAADAGESGLYRSDDGGATWHKVSSTNPRPLYFSQVRVDPNNPDRVFMGGVKMSLTIDGGKTTEGQASLAAHDDVHAIWLDPANSDHMMIGDDGGVSVSYDGAKTWNFFANLPVGLFYHVGYDMAYPFNVCGGMQDNYDWCGPSASRFSERHHELGLVPDPGRRRLRRDSRPERLALDLQRDAGRQHHPAEQDHRRIEADPAERAQRDAGAKAGRVVPLGMGHADDHLAERSGRADRRGESRLRLARPRRLVDDDQPRPHDEREPRHDRHDGPQGLRDQHLARRRRVAVAGDRLARRVAEAAGGVLHGERRRAALRVA